MAHCSKLPQASSVCLWFSRASHRLEENKFYPGKLLVKKKKKENMDRRRLTASTPVSETKTPTSRRKWFDIGKGKELFKNRWVNYRPVNDDAKWDEIEGPRYVDFNEPSPDFVDEFFDFKSEADDPSPQEKEEMALPTSTDLMEIAETLSVCSISMIDDNAETLVEEMEEDKSMPSDNSNLENTVVEMGGRFSMGCKMETAKKNDNNNCHRRMSTIPSPFSFESREESKCQRKQARQAFKSVMEELQKPVFKARPAPKTSKLPLVSQKQNVSRFSRSSMLQKVEIPRGKTYIKKENQPPNQPEISVKEKSSIVNTNLISKIEKPSVVRRTFAGFVKPTVVPKMASKIPPPTEKTGFLASKPDKIIANVQQKDKKPSEFGNPRHSTSTIAKSPKLLTAQRAQQRQLFDEKIREREREREERKKQEIAAKLSHEKQEIARLRKLTVHKARPVPQSINNPHQPVMTKRQLTQPTIPELVKRRRIK